MVQLNSAYERIKNLGAEILAIHTECSEPGTVLTVKRNNLAFPLANDDHLRVVDKYSPTSTYLIDRHGIIRARYRKSLEKATMLSPAEVADVSIELYPTANVFKKGHRIRVDVSSSNFPRFDLNPNTGEPLNNNRRTAIATNTVYVGGVRPSQVLLPVVVLK